MKICYVISEIDKAVFFEDTLTGLRRKGFEVSCILINCEHGELAAFLAKNRFEVHHFSVRKISRSLRVILSVRSVLRKLKPDVVHCHLSTANWTGLWAAKLAGTRHRIFTRHSGEPLALGKKESVIDAVQNRLATKIVSISLNIDDLLAKQGVPAKKRVLIHHGFDLKRFAQPDTGEVLRIRSEYNPRKQFPVIGVIARWMEWKGVQYTIEAFKNLLLSHPDGLLCFFGVDENGDYYRNLKAQLAEIPEKNYLIVNFEKNVFDLYQLFDVYVHVPVNPSAEAFGQTYVEALAAGIPSVFTSSGVAREFMLNGENGLVVPFRDSQAITAAIRQLLEDEPLRNRLIANGRKSVEERFAFTVYLDKLTGFYRSLS